MVCATPVVLFKCGLKDPRTYHIWSFKCPGIYFSKIYLPPALNWDKCLFEQRRLFLYTGYTRLRSRLGVAGLLATRLSYWMHLPDCNIRNTVMAVRFNPVAKRQVTPSLERNRGVESHSHDSVTLRSGRRIQYESPMARRQATPSLERNHNLL